MSNPTKARKLLVREIAVFGELQLMDIALEAGKQAKSRKEGRAVSSAEFLADVVNHQMMTGKANGIELFQLIDAKHKTNQKL